MSRSRTVRLSEVSREKIDSVESRKRKAYDSKRNVELLEKCQILWSNLDNFRRKRERCFRYVYGDQWSDFIEYKGETITERQYISMKGNIPLVNNVIRRLVNSVSGLYLKSETEPVASARDRDEQKTGEMMTIALQANWQINKMNLLLANILEDYLIGGAALEKEVFAYFNGNKDVLSKIVNPNYMFYDSTMTDPRFWDLSIIGEIHDVTFNDLVSNFSKSKKDYEMLCGIYKSERTNSGFKNTEDPNEKHRLGNINFYAPSDSSLCRVYEVWTKEIKERYLCYDPAKGELYKIEKEDLGNVELENERRKSYGMEDGVEDSDIAYIRCQYMIDNYWHYQFLSPNGDIIKEGESPYFHGSHPYSISLYPFINGEIHSFVADFIDQQRYINRLITIDDFVRRTGAKGVTLVPRQLVPEDMDYDEFAEQWSSVDGLIVYEAKKGIPMPQQFYSSAVTLNTAELVSLQLQMMNDISNVHESLQGKQPYSGTSAALYAQQSQNSATGLAALILRFSAFVEDIAVKKVKLIQQYYTEKRLINITGKAYSGTKEYDPQKARDVQFDLSIKESASTPVYRMVANDMLMEFWKAGAITLEMLLENGDFPFADSLLQSLSSAKEQMAQNGSIPAMAGYDVQMQSTPNMQAAQQYLRN